MTWSLFPAIYNDLHGLCAELMPLQAESWTITVGKALTGKLSLKEENCHLTTQMDNQMRASCILGFVPKRVLKG